MKRAAEAQEFTPIFNYSLQVAVTDLNYGNHVGNDRILGFFHAARVQWLDHHHLSELDIGGCGMIMANVAIDYLSQARLHQALNIAIGVSEVGKTRFSLLYHCYDTNTQASVARGITQLSCFDYQQQKPARMPASFAQLLFSCS